MQKDVLGAIITVLVLAQVKLCAALYSSGGLAYACMLGHYKKNRASSLPRAVICRIFEACG